jgi:thiol-disulfide isomerase/thioredoxin
MERFAIVRKTGDTNMPRSLILPALLLACTAGCLPVGYETQTTLPPAGASGVQPGDQSARQEPGGTAAAAAAEVKLELASYDQLQEKIKEFRGQVVVVDVWSTSCPPCMKEFPNLVALARRFPDDVACISFNVDYLGLPKKAPADYVPEVKKFLEEQQATITNLLSTEADSDVLEKFEVASMPAILVYDREGALVARLSDDNASEGVLSYKNDVLPLVERLATTRPAAP